jgi:hypothetical protein
LLLVRSLSAGPSVFDTFVAITVSVAIVAAPLPRAMAGARNATGVYTKSARPDSSAPAPPRTIPVTNTEYFLRDAVPTAGFAVEPEDTTDDAFLPEEKDTSTLVWEIAAWVVGAALIAFFIIEVFIKDDTEEPEDDDGGKPDPF